MTDLINNMVKEGCNPDDWCLCKIGTVTQLCVVHTELLEQPINVLERVLERGSDVGCQLMACNLVSSLAMEPLILCSPCDKFRKDTKQGRRCTQLLRILRKNLREVARWALRVCMSGTVMA